MAEKMISIRGMDPGTWAVIKMNAAARGLTASEYLRRLYDLHELAKARVLNGLLEDVHLEEVRR